jgi:DNA replication protein DnaC
MAKFVSCRKCHNKSRLAGYISIVDSDGYEKYVECECHARWKLEKDLNLRLSSSGISLTDYEYDISSYVGSKSLHEVEKLKKYVANFSQFRSEALYFFGDNGTQKTTLAKWVGGQLLKKKYKVQYVLMQNLVKALTVLDDDEREEKVRKYYDCDLLIIDEVFDRNKVTLYKSNFQIPFLDQFIRDRLDSRQLAIIFVSNKTVSQISEEGFGMSLQDFIQRKTVPKKSILTFLDRYNSEVNARNIKGIFD